MTYEFRRDIDREIVRMTLPTVLSNIMVPVLALCDTAVAGHMPHEMYLGGVAIGSVMVTTSYWLFNFLRAGTSGITAVAYGAGSAQEMAYALMRSVCLAIVLGLMIMAFHPVLGNMLLWLIGASEEVSELAERYFNVCICGAIPMMLLTAVSGWLVGMQSTGKAMVVNVSLSLLNVAVTLLLVYACGWGFDGIPFGTLISQWLILIPASYIVLSLCRKNGIRLDFELKTFCDPEEWKRLFNVNSNLFFRSACVIAATMILYACGARMGDVVIGANAVINQLFLFFSYFMDGFAFTGEALVGKFSGASDSRSLTLSLRRLLVWTAGMTLMFAVLYAVGLPHIVSFLSDSDAVRTSVENCRLLVVCIPLAGALAFIYDGFYVGMTNTRPMLLATLAGLGVFIVVLYLSATSQIMLWSAFICYLSVRSLVLILLFPAGLLRYDKI